MKLSIVTINYNDAKGLAKTLKSVASQVLSDKVLNDGFSLEHIVIDGGSTDNSVDIIKQYPHVSKWISEKDGGIYDAMNKGICMATGDYIQILNAGDIFASKDVICKMENVICGMEKIPEILYGNMLKAMPDGELVRDNCGGPGVGNSFLYFYRGTLNHDCAWIKRELFDRFGLYDEDMKICSDWKWYVMAIAYGKWNMENGTWIPPLKPEQIQYVDIDVTIFDMNGISESGGKNRDLIQKERRGYLEQILPASVLADYDEFSLPIEQYRRLKRYHIWSLVYFVERILFKLEKWNILRN